MDQITTVLFLILPVLNVGDQVCDKCIQWFMHEGSFVENKEESGIK